MFKRTLIIEDDQDISRLVQLHLEDLGSTVDMDHRGDTGLLKALSNPYDFIILDLTLPGLDGIEICRRLRARPSYTPILMLTARSTEFDRVLGLEIGADDYLSKPFSIRELLARVKALFRRVDALGPKALAENEEIIHAGHLEIDPEKRKVTLQGKAVELTAKEFDLLVQFARHPGRVYSRSQLLDIVWGYGHDGYEHTVNSHINRLRSKIESNPARPRYVITVWGVGYRFSDQDEWPKD